MAVSKSITRTDTSITITLSGFTKVSAGSSFYYSIWNDHDAFVFEEDTVPYDCTSWSHTFYGLDPGENYCMNVELVTSSGSSFNYPSSGYYDYSDGVYTTGTSPWDVSGVTPYVFEYGESASVYLSGLSKVGVTRYLWVRSTDGTVDETFTISANSSTKSFSISGLEEKTDYTFQIYLFFYPWGQETDENIAYWSETFNSGYATGGSLSVSGVSEKGCTLSVSGIPATTKYPRTLQWYGKEGSNGQWELLTTTTATNSGTQTHSRNDLLPLTYYEFKVSVYVGGEHVDDLTAKCTTESASGNLAAGDVTEYSAKLTLSRLATGVSFVRRIKWYYKAASDGEYTKFETVSTVAQSASSASIVLDTLASDTAYSFKAEICDSNDRVLGTKQCTATTLPTVAEISAGNITSASIKVAVSGLTNVAYSRTFEWWYKRQGEADYQLFDKTELLASDNSTEVTKVFKPLAPSTYYDLKVHILKDKATMRILTVSARTALDNSLVPDAEIHMVEQHIGETKVKVFWDAPNHENGAYYKVQYSTDNENYIDATATLTQPPVDGSYTEITLPELDTDYYIQIMSYFQVEEEIASKFSDSFGVYTFSILKWDTEKVTGQPFRVTSDEWNKLIRVVKERLEMEDVIVSEIPLDAAVKGKDFTAEHFNQMVRAVNIFNPHEIMEVEEGQAITDDLLNQLLAEINLE